MAKQTKSKNQLRREKAKLKKQEEKEAPKTQETTQPKQTTQQEESASKPTDSSLSSSLDDLTSLPEFSQFQKVFDRFHTEESVPQEDPTKGTIIESDNDNDNDEDEEKEQAEKPGKNKLRKMKKISLVQLKSLAKNEELVQWYDVDAMDPVLVVELKSHKNYIPVPVHWQQKREYLSSRRAMDKKAFELPSFITDTGITNMRDTTQEDEATMKQKMREQVQPKMNRLDLDYQKLHDAFFKFQTKPRMSDYGDVFFEGKVEEEINYAQFRPGRISAVLKNALGLQSGVPPPWIQKMQQLGPPPAYKDVLYPGYNAPMEDDDSEKEVVGVERELFGKLLVVNESEDEEEEEEEGEDNEDEEVPQYEDDEDDEPVVVEEEEIQQEVRPAQEEQSDDDIELPEIQSREQERQQIEPKKLYEILKEKALSGSGLMANARSYEIPSEDGSVKRKSSGGDEKPAKKAKTEKKDEDGDEEDEEGGKFKF